MYRAIYRAGFGCVCEIEDGVITWQSPDYEASEKPQSHMIQTDIQPYKSMIDGSFIGSRSKHRAHLKQHGCIEVGNETKYLKSKPLEAPSGLKETLIQVANDKLRS